MNQPTIEVSTPTSRQQLALADSLTIGRQLGNALVIEDALASRFHCVIEKIAGGFRVRDLGSRNGTKVNGKLINSARFGENDTIMIGTTTLRLVGQRAPVYAAPVHAGPVLQVGDDMMEEIVDDEPLDDLEVITPAPPVKSAAPSMIPREMLPSRHAPANLAPPPAAQAAVVLDPDAPPAERLFAMAEALPEKTFGQNEIALVNARGGIAHPAGSTPKIQSDGSDAVTLLRLLLLVCFRTRASDIHIEPKNDLFLVRVRIDGGLVDAAKLKKEFGVKLCAVIKILADIDIAQRNAVQEGQFSSRVPDRGVDYRVSFTPSLYARSASFAFWIRPMHHAICGI